MKKIITLCLFVFAMFIGNQSIVAQNSKLINKVEINSIAAEKTEALRKFVKFSDSQRDRVYLALREYTIANMTIEKQNNEAEGEVKKIEERLESKMKGILTEEQFIRYKEFPQE
jgi:hypothetical protein